MELLNSTLTRAVELVTNARCQDFQILATTSIGEIQVATAYANAALAEMRRCTQFIFPDVSVFFLVRFELSTNLQGPVIISVNLPSHWLFGNNN